MAKYEGDISYQKLITSIYGMNKTNLNLTVNTGYQENNKSIRADEFVLQQPLLFIRTGLYNYSAGTRDNRSSFGYYWESTALSGIYAYALYFGSAVLTPPFANLRGRQFSLRCVAK